MSRRPLSILVALALTFRLAVVLSFHATAGDGTQYYKLAEQLRLTGRFAYAGPPAPSTWSRLPGYPLFLAATSVFHRGPSTIEEHTTRAVCENAVLDVGTALLVFAMLEAAAGMVAAYLGFVFVVLCPIMVICSAHALTESLATFLTTLVVFLCLRARAQRTLLPAVSAGLALGFMQLMRVDSFTVLPALVIAMCWKIGGGVSRRTVSQVIGLGLAALVVWAPWPIRNEIEFGAMHAEGTEWLAMDGTPMRSGVMTWMRSWASGQPGEGYHLMAISIGLPLDVKRPRIVLHSMYDDPLERQQVVDVLTEYNRHSLSAKADARFIEMGRARAKARPFRQYVTLPARRLVSLWTPVPVYEMSIRVPWLGMPRGQLVYGTCEAVLFGLSLLMLIVYARRYAVLFAVAAAVIVARSLLHATVAHPCPTERYVVECVPMLLLCGAAGIATLLASRRATP
ncbi:MAG: hypothetical protein ABI321_08270 [Polyangia bacterium]